MKEDSSFEVSVDDLLETDRCFGTENLEVCLQLGERMRRLQISNRLRGLIASIRTIASIGRLALENYFTLEIHSQDPQVSEIKPGFELESFGSPLHSFWLLHEEHWNVL